MICCEPCFRDNGTMNEASLCLGGVYMCREHARVSLANKARGFLARITRRKGAAA